MNYPGMAKQQLSFFKGFPHNALKGVKKAYPRYSLEWQILNMCR